MWVAANRSQHSAIRIEGSIEAPPRTRRVERVGRPAARPTGWPEHCERLKYFVRSVKTRRDPARVMRMRENVRRLAHPHAAEEIVCRALTLHAPRARAGRYARGAPA